MCSQYLYLSRLHLVALCAALLSIAGSAMAQTPPSPQQLLDAAHKTSDATPLIPYELNAAIVVSPGSKNEHLGHLTIYRDNNRVRVDLQVADHKDSYLRLGDKSYINPRASLLGASGLGEIDRAWDAQPSTQPGLIMAPPKLKTGRISRETVGGAEAWCFDKKSEYSKTRLCFEGARGVMLRESLNTSTAASQTEFFDFGSAGQVVYPRRMKIQRDHTVPIEVRDIRIESKALGAEIFAVPENSLEMETCMGEKPPGILFQPEPEFPESSGYKSMDRKVGLNVIITKEGTVTGIEVVRSASSDFDLKAQQAVAKWRFKPAKCGDRPVNTKVYVEVEFSR